MRGLGFELHPVNRSRRSGNAQVFDPNPAGRPPNRSRRCGSRRCKLGRGSALLSLVMISSLAASATSVGAADVELRFSAPPGTSLVSIQLLLEEVSRDVGETPSNRYELDVEVPGSAMLDLEVGSVWRLAVTSEVFWAAPEIVSIDAEPAVVFLELLPAATVVGEVEVERSEEPPTELDLRFASPPGDSREIARFTVTCPIDDREFACRVPATRLDLRLRATGFVSHYFWDVEPRPSSQHRLGALKLRRGGSIVGWIHPEDSRAPFDNVEVNLTREIATTGFDETATQRRGSLAQQATVNRRGFFELAGVSEGLYAVTVRHPDFAEARYAPIQVLRNAETELDPIELHPGVVLRLVLRPDRPALDQRWRIELLRRGEAPGHLEIVHKGEANEEGRWNRPELAPGNYVLRIEGGLESTWHTEELYLPPGTGTLEYPIGLPAVELAGQVFLGSEPLRAELYFGGTTGAVRIPATSDDEGRFQVIVPVRESWIVDVFNRALNVAFRFPEVIPEELSEDRRGGLELVIPDTRFEGTVVDIQGEPVEGASIWASGPGGQTQRSDADGAFMMRGLRPGKYRINAESGDGRLKSSIHYFELDDEDSPAPIELVLTAGRWIEGQVIGPSGRGVVGAKIVALVEQSRQRWIATTTPETFTDLSGTFSLNVPDLTEGVQLTVFPPGFATRQLRVDSRSEEPLLISVEPHGGTLRVRYGEEPLNRISIFRAYALPFYPYLINWAALNGEENRIGGTLSLPMLEPGYYYACKDLAVDVRLAGHLPPGAESRCVGGALSPYGELVLEFLSEVNVRVDAAGPL